MLAFWPNTQVIDVLYFNRNNRRWYAGSGLNTNNGGNCPSTNTGTVWPVLGVYAAPPVGSTAIPTFVGAQCSGRSGRIAAVDPIGNNIYVPTAQFPSDPASNSTGQTGILVFHDDTAVAQATPQRSQAILQAFPITINGVVTFTLQGRTMNAFASLSGLVDAQTRLIVTTTAGNETISCNEAGGKAICTGALVGDPVIGGVVLLGNNQKTLARARIVASSPFLVTGITLDSDATVGGSYMASIAGSNITAQTNFDVRYLPPGKSAEEVTLNWQTGQSASKSVPTGTATGVWKITGVRPHEDAVDHTGSFVSVSAAITIR